MNIFGVLNMVGGLALFLFGMNAMGNGLAKLSGGKLERILEKLTANKFMAVVLGALVTAVIQSSSATTVMVVGFVNSGIMQLQQAVGIIMGANIGTTITSWMLSLTGIDGGNFFVQMLKPSSFSPVLALVGIVLTMTSKEDDKKSDIGNILMGFAILMFGMETMSSAVKPLADVPEFTGILTKFSNPVLGMIAGAVLTAAIQSSSASVGILQALCVTGAITYGSAIPIIMGQNIGTCVTALISSTGASRNAKRASMIHLYFNMIGTILFMVVFYAINMVFPFAFLEDSVGAAGIAVVHSLFNVGCTVALFPFSNLLLKLVRVTIPEHVEEQGDLENKVTNLDARFLERPAFAMELTRHEVYRMAQVSQDCITIAIDSIEDYSDKDAEKVAEMENQVDHFEDEIGSYLVKLGNTDLNREDSKSVSILQHSIIDLERITDHAINITEICEKISSEKGDLSKRAKEELNVYCKALREIVSRTVRAFCEEDILLAREIEPLEETIDLLSHKLEKRNKKRYRKGKYSAEMMSNLQELFMNTERVADHCSNIALTMLRIHEGSFNTHEYADLAREDNDPWFQWKMEEYQGVYVLPKKHKNNENE